MSGIGVELINDGQMYQRVRFVLSGVPTVHLQRVWYELADLVARTGGRLGNVSSAADGGTIAETEGEMHGYRVDLVKLQRRFDGMGHVMGHEIKGRCAP
jgi:hypothetical protein